MTTDVYPGKELGTLDLTITADMVQHYIKGLDEPNPWYTTTSPFGGPHDDEYPPVRRPLACGPQGDLNILSEGGEKPHEPLD